MLDINQGKSMKTSSIIYEELKSLIKKIDGCKNNSEKSSTVRLDSIFPVDIQCLQHGHLMVQKISMVYKEVNSA